ncbi:cation diffusion facilitator family transporter [Microbacterium sp. M3]|uniref:Cation diffusion facilitator family transporter n=1 Tax=Microbacterium arthrosphaerae TaxID=792652 RepID=A0ABU4H1R4_9MICO|nr:MULTISPECIES: cation diffusion facilitator family transporter [Microbacterium]MDW4573263.1 cation diffusion facilitator family transporter [Microbacterium arthrosphaerae]MDW7607118.1 cation diffusion facilitator family transporter [Microbacterium sp. M3]
MKTLGRTDLPAAQQQALRSAIRWEWFTIGYTIVTIGLIALVVGGSQAMKTAWIEDMLSLIPQISFLVALLFIRRPPTRAFPFGLHRVMGVGHLVAGVALFAVGGNLAYEAISGLVRAEHPSIGTVNLLGQTIWLGWFMVGVMSLVVIGPFFYGHAKAKLAPRLHNKVLYADADMAKADWTSTVASIVGVLGVGIGLWWLDGAAALFISIGIIWDGWRNSRAAVRDLIDQRARTEDDARPHPLIARVANRVDEFGWVRESAVRMRDMGQVFHVEVFVVPTGDEIGLDDIEEAREAVAALDWKVQDVVVIPTRALPDEAEPARARADRRDA